MRSRARAAMLLLTLASFGTSSAALAEEKKVAAQQEAAALPEPEAGPSADAARLTNWIVSSGDNGDNPFLVIDKTSAEVLVFNSKGKLIGKSAALLGSTPGDESSPGVGDRELSDIAPEERTTPAGRFVAKMGYARGRERVLWVDYATAISLHPVVTGNPKQQRLKRLKSPTAEDNRITFGCINVPRPFYTKVVQPLLKKRVGIVYILPETKSLAEVFLAFHG